VRALAIVHQADAGPGVFAELIRSRGWELESWSPPTEPAPRLDGRFDAALIFGAAMNVDEEVRHPWLAIEKDWLRSLLVSEVPVLGICLGAQLLAEAAGAPGRRARTPEIGWHRVEINAEGASDPVVGPLAPAFEAFEWHSYEAPLPPAAIPLAASAICLQAYRLGAAAWGIQFHPEVSAADAESWIDDYRSDVDAVRIGVDPEWLRGETRARIDAWNRLGRELCERFLAVTRG
jgi:GMP synthase (glutamine-hydrolysing)